MAGRKECSISVQGVKIKQWGAPHTENDESVDTEDQSQRHYV